MEALRAVFAVTFLAACLFGIIATLIEMWEHPIVLLPIGAAFCALVAYLLSREFKT